MIRLPIVLAATTLTVLVTGCGGIEDDVAERTGRNVTCAKSGVMLIAGERETIYSCIDDRHEPAGCYARVDGDLYDVSEQARALGSLQGTTIDC